MKTDLLNGKPVKSIIVFSLPIMASGFLQFLYNLIDNIIVGRYVGTDALAAVGSVSPINSFLVGTALGLCSGFTIPVARCFGSGEKKKMNHYIGNSVTLAFIVGMFLVIFAHIVSNPLLHLMNTPSNIFSLASDYIRILYFGIPISMLYNNFTGVSRSVGDSKTPLYFLIISSITNLCLDLLFVKSFGWGVKGAAVATIIAQGISALLAGIYIFKKNVNINTTKDDFKPDFKTYGYLMKIGIPLSLQFTITAVGSMCLQGAVNKFGSNVVAAFTAANKVENIANIPLSGFGVSLCTFISQNFGAENYNKIRVNFRKILVIDILFSAVSSALILLCGEWAVSMFMTDMNSEIMSAAKQYLLAVAECYSLLSVLFVFRNSLQGLGFTYANAIAGGAELFGRIFVAYGLTKWIGFNAVCYAGPVAWLFADIPLVIIYIIKSKWLKNLHNEQKMQTNGRE